MAALDLVDWPADQPLCLSGGPSSLRIPVTIYNPSDRPLAVNQASLVDVRASSGQPLSTRSIGVGLTIAAASTARGQVWMRLDPATPPGRYEGGIEIAGVARPVQIDVLETVKLSIRPSPLVIDLALGRSQRAAVAFENRGNVPLTIDVAGVYPIGEEIPIFPERIDREDGDTIERLADLFARTIGARARRAMRETGAITLAMPDGAARVEPGTAQTVAVGVSLPEGLAQTGRYRAFIPIYSSDLELVVVTAAKQAPPTERPRNRGTPT